MKIYYRRFSYNTFISHTHTHTHTHIYIYIYIYIYILRERGWKREMVGQTEKGKTILWNFKCLLHLSLFSILFWWWLYLRNIYLYLRKSGCIFRNGWLQMYLSLIILKLFFFVCSLVCLFVCSLVCLFVCLFCFVFLRNYWDSSPI